MDKRLKRILPRVQKPARYTGGEYREIIKDKAAVDLRMAFCFPDVYEIGMSNVGMRILYSTINALDGVWCERVFAPWDDMEREMRENGIPLYALESGDPLTAFGICWTSAVSRCTHRSAPRFCRWCLPAARAAAIRSRWRISLT